MELQQRDKNIDDIDANCAGCQRQAKHIKHLQEEVSHLVDRLESARDQIMVLLLRQRNNEACTQDEYEKAQKSAKPYEKAPSFSSLVISQRQDTEIRKETPKYHSERKDQPGWDILVVERAKSIL